jgi:hypothetical protein
MSLTFTPPLVIRVWGSPPITTVAGLLHSGNFLAGGRQETFSICIWFSIKPMCLPCNFQETTPQFRDIAGGGGYRIRQRLPKYLKNLVGGNFVDILKWGVISWTILGLKEEEKFDKIYFSNFGRKTKKQPVNTKNHALRAF